MIEFRAECGHTVRARNEDAGKMVNCAYCGRRAPVPSQDEDAVESLLAETLEESRSQLGELEQGKSYWGKGRGMAPLRIAWTAIFLVLMLSVLALTGRWVIREIIQAPDEPSTPAAPQQDRVARREQGPMREPTEEALDPTKPPRAKNALADLNPLRSGVCVFSIPANLDVYIQELPFDQSERFDLDDYKGTTSMNERLTVELDPGRYRVSIVAQIRNPDLMDYADYATQVRQSISRTGEVSAAEDYFLEDGAQEWRMERIGGQECLVKGIEVDLGREWRPICALFVPGSAHGGNLLKFAPPDPRMEFRYNERRAEQELRFWGVRQDEFDMVLPALSRIGKAVIRDPGSGAIRIFQVWPDESVVGMEVQGEQVPPGP